ncbi:MAG: HelD family protein, partial [Acidimicrobiales bacterium]
QAYLDQAYGHLARMGERTAAAAEDAAERAKADWNAAVAHGRLMDRLASISDDRRPLCFGRIDEEEGAPRPGPSWYIGRRHVEDSSGAPVVVDWRAPVAVPFYRATYLDPLGLALRRRFILDGRTITDLLDERFDDPEAGAMAAAAGLPDPLLAELGRARSGPMRDIVATIAAEQDRIIRSPLEIPLIVQGGPGTGKTAVALHRAAYLLYEHRDYLSRQGVLVLGPNRRFLAYIAEVLPSLGEMTVVQTTLPGLIPSAPVRAGEAEEVARLKGDPRLAEVLARASVDDVRPPPESVAANTRWGTVHLDPKDLEELIGQSLESGGAAGLRRSRFRRAVIRRVALELSERRGPALVGAEEVTADLRRDAPFQRALDRAWPNQSAAGLVRGLLGRGSTLARAGSGLLDPAEMRLLTRRPARSAAQEPWTEADVALIDEADSILGSSARRYGHVVIDEAQDLSPMAWRMAARRSADGRSMTILGDLAQATAPAALRRWEDVISAIGRPPGAEVAELSVGYRVPRPIMEFANRLLPSIAVGLRPTDAVRPWGEPPTVIPVGTVADVHLQVVARAETLAATHQSVAVIAPPERAAALRARFAPGPGQVVSAIEPVEAKGLEFDAVIVAEPADIFGLSGGPGLLYIALTRAVQEMVVVHHAALPHPLL